MSEELHQEVSPVASNAGDPTVNVDACNNIQIASGEQAAHEGELDRLAWGQNAGQMRQPNRTIR